MHSTQSAICFTISVGPSVCLSVCLSVRLFNADIVCLIKCGYHHTFDRTLRALF